jgi:peptide deformylase
MTRRTILEHPDPRLRLPSAPVEAFDAELWQLVDDLLDTLETAGGLALSAPQLGELRSVLVLRPNGQNAAEVYVNPEILAKKAWGLVEESCLSVPGVVGNVLRATQIRVRARDRNGHAFERELHGMDAVCLQHEMDHLAGVLFVDRLSIFRKLQMRFFSGTRPAGRSDAA